MRAGLACGGAASVLVQPAAAYPVEDLRRVSEVQIAATRLLEAGEL